MKTFWHDIRYAARVLRARPGFALVSVLTLALGIGANTAIFSVVNAVLLRPLPYHEPERIMALWPARAGSSLRGVSEPKFVFWREHSRSFEALAATQGLGAGVNLTGGSEPEFVAGLKASAEFFRVLGVEPAAGRGFSREEDAPGGGPVVVISDGLWRRRFGADPAIVGRAVLLNGQPHTVVGVMPRGFRYSAAADVLTPLRADPASRAEGHNFTVLGRLRPGVTREQATHEMQLVFEEFRSAHPNMIWRREEGIRVEGYQEALTAASRPLLYILLGAVGLVLLIACANVANLQLTHATGRRKEVAVRLALGASRGRVARQLLTEGLLLSVAGGVAGLLLAVWGVDLLAALMPAGLLPRSGEIGFDSAVLLFTFTAAVSTGVLFALAPVLQASRVDVNDALKDGRGTAGADRARLRGALVVAEVALALVLLVGAGLLIRTFANLRGVEPGFDPSNVLTLQVSPAGERYAGTAAQAEYFRRALERVRALPGVEAAAATSNLPLGQWLNLTVEVEGQPESARSTEYRMVTPEYFRVMRMRLLRGREFSEGDAGGAEPVAVVNEAFARRHFADSDPLGQRVVIQREAAGAKSCRIVGVVNDVKQFGLASPAPETVFVPLAQVPDAVMRTARSFVTMKLAVRTAGDPLALGDAVKRELLAVDASLPPTEVRTLEQIVSQAVAPERFNMTLLGVFAAIGLVLASVGIYGVVSYMVAQRTREIGIRMALGAQQGDVLRFVVRRGMWLALAGAGLGLLASLALTQLVEGFLYGVSATDPLTFAGVAALLVTVALLASLVPARRAAKVDPMEALRYE